MQSLDDVIIAPDLTLAEAMVRLDEAGTGALVLCTEGRKLFGLLTDGDIRRALLSGTSLDTSIEKVANRNPAVAPSGMEKSEALQFMMQREIDQLPLVDDFGVFQDLMLRKILVAEDDLRGAEIQRIDGIIIRPDRLISEAIAQLDRAGTGALVISSQGRRLEGLLTDGDIRRAILKGTSLEKPCGDIAKRDPFTVRHLISSADALQLMMERDINQLPVVDSEGNLQNMLLRRELAQDNTPSLSAVIMAGGFGKRLRPLTQNIPKPMLPVGDRPLLERTIERLCQAGVRNVHMTTHYLPEQIKNYFGNGENFGVNVDYAQEDNPMGTAGGLRLLPRPSLPLVVINGDILTGVSFDEMLRFHKRHKAQLTVGVRRYEVKVPFGVVECNDVRITGLREKPSLNFFINAGIYMLEPTAYDMIPEGIPFDMTDLIDTLIQNGQMVVSFPIIEYWLDIGHHEDYEKAQEDYRNGSI